MQDPNLRKAWSKALKQILNMQDLVCELHFKKDDIIREDTFLLPDGSVQKIKRKIFSPRKGALPFIQENDLIRVN